MRYKRKTNTKKYLLILLGLLLAGGLVFAYIQLENIRDSDDTAQEESTIDFGPPTEEEQRAGDERKDIIDEQQGSSSNDVGDDQTTNDKKSADVVIVDASQYDNTIEVRAFVSNHVEGGTCSYRFTRGNNTINKSLPAHADASTSICPMLEVDRSEFPSSGDWQLVVSYESANAKGLSDTKTVTIN